MLSRGAHPCSCNNSNSRRSRLPSAAATGGRGARHVSLLVGSPGNRCGRGREGWRGQVIGGRIVGVAWWWSACQQHSGPLFKAAPPPPPAPPCFSPSFHLPSYPPFSLLPDPPCPHLPPPVLTHPFQFLSVLSCSSPTPSCPPPVLPSSPTPPRPHPFFLLPLSISRSPSISPSPPSGPPVPITASCCPLLHLTASGPSLPALNRLFPPEANLITRHPRPTPAAVTLACIVVLNGQRGV